MQPPPDLSEYSGIPAWPFVAMMLAGFVIGGLGHLFGSRTAVGAGIALIFTSMVVLPVLAVLLR